MNCTLDTVGGCRDLEKTLELQADLGRALRDRDTLELKLAAACSVIASQRLTLRWVVEDAEALQQIALELQRSKHGMTLAAIRSGFVSHGTFHQNHPPETNPDLEVPAMLQHIGELREASP